MDHSLGVGVGQSAGHLRRDVHRLLNRKRPFLNPQVERLPAKQFEHQERPVLAPPHLEEGDQVWVCKAGDSLCLAGDLAFLLPDATRADDLHRHLAAQVPVPGLVDDPESAAPKLPNDLEAPDNCSGGTESGSSSCFSGVAATSWRSAVNAPGFTPVAEPQSSRSPSDTRTPRQAD